MTEYLSFFAGAMMPCAASTESRQPFCHLDNLRSEKGVDDHFVLSRIGDATELSWQGQIPSISGHIPILARALAKNQNASFMTALKSTIYVFKGDPDVSTYTCLRTRGSRPVGPLCLEEPLGAP